MGWLRYKPHEKFLLYHEEDDVLNTISVPLPEPPPQKEIDGFGKKPKYQKWKRPSYPEKLRELEKSCSSIKEVWEKLDYYKDNYKEEIEFIRREWDRRINGYWFYNNGVPTFIDGWHYMYLSYWKLDVGYPEYRSRDRKFFIFVRYSYTTTEAYYRYRVIDKVTEKVLSYFSNEKELMKFLRDKDPDFVRAQRGHFYVDMGRRVCYGINYPKHRREGATYKADHILFNVITTLEEAHGGIQSMDGVSAAKAFSKAIVKPWKKLPFFFSPNFAGSTDPKRVLEFDVPAQRSSSITGSVNNIEVGLESFIDFADSANRSWYDGDKLMVLHNDELGKTILEDVNARWMVQKRCLAQGNGILIHGLAVNTSTVGEMTEKGGANFFRLCQQSHWENRNSVGQTQSGLFNLFIPAYDGLEGYIDIFGNSIIEDPSDSEIWKWKHPVRDKDGKLQGAKRFLEERLEEILLRNDPQSVSDYEEEIRLHPMSFSQCFITAGSGSGLNMKNIIRRIKTLKFEKATKRVDFKWKNGIKDTEVIMVNNPVSGRFVVSLELSPGESNNKIQTTIIDISGEYKTVWRPLTPWKFTAGSDPYKFRKTEGKRLSKGAGTVFFNRDKTIDPDGKPILDWQTFRTVCTYSYRPPTPEDYAEDMLMMCIYYGAMMFPEINIPIVWNHFVDRGYDGYLKYGKNPDGKWRNTPGYTLRGAWIQKLLQLHQLYVENFIELEKHIDLLIDLKGLKGPEDITNHDLVAAGGGALMGSEIDYSEFYNPDEQQGETYDISEFF